MASPLSIALAQWLATKPGPIRAKEQHQVWALAHQMSGLSGKVDLDSFSSALDRCGYRPMPRGGHSGVAPYYILALPEQQAGSRT